jgi:hypothetical protein
MPFETRLFYLQTCRSRSGIDKTIYNLKKLETKDLQNWNKQLND